MTTITRQVRNLDGSVANVTVSYHTDGSLSTSGNGGHGTARAAGGAIFGSGPKGVDSVRAILAPGEHVLTASDVDRMGGQAAVYEFRRALQAGVARYASGGRVTASPQRYADGGAIRSSISPVVVEMPSQITVRDARGFIATMEVVAADKIARYDRHQKTYRPR